MSERARRNAARTKVYTLDGNKPRMRGVKAEYVVVRVPEDRSRKPAERAARRKRR